MMIVWWLAGGAVLILAALTYWPIRRMLHEVSVERAHELFQLQREMLEAKFLELARSGDHPRGLTWADCEFERVAHFARHRKTGEIVAFVQATVQFDLARSRSPQTPVPTETQRRATAVFLYHHGQWGTVGRTLFDMSPGDALHLYQADYEPLHFAHESAR
jgi:hypothetical protein